METFLNTLATQFPSLVFGVLLVGVVVWAYRQVGQIGSRLERQVEDRVALAMSHRLVELEDLTWRAQRQSTQLQRVVEEADSQSRQFTEDMQRLRQDVDQQATDLRRLIGQVRLEIPEDIDWISAQELVIRARGAETWRDASVLLERVSRDESATAEDMELAGDEARRRRAFQKARDFYQSAVDRDPERKSARVELLAITAEIDFARRNEALRELEDLVVQPLVGRIPLGRYFDALMELDRYQQMGDFCRALLERKDLDLSPELVAIVRRNYAVALRRTGRLDEAAQQYEAAYRALPTDENIVRPYAVFLRDEVGNWEGFDQLSSDLVQLDPTDPEYAYFMAQALEHRGEDQPALEWLERAWNLNPDAPRRYLIAQLQRRIHAKLGLFLEAEEIEEGTEETEEATEKGEE